MASRRRRPGPEDYQARGVLYVAEEARLSAIATAPEGADVGGLLNDAMKAVERDNPELAGVLPQVYARLGKSTLVELIRLLAPLTDSVKGDAFGLIYEYFLAAFAMQEGRGGGEFFTPGCDRVAAGRGDRALSRSDPRRSLRLGRHVRALGQVREPPQT